MKQTAVQKMIEYFIEQKSNGVSHWCIEDLLAQLYQAKEIEKEQIMNAWLTTRPNTLNYWRDEFEQYYNETFKQE